MKPIKIKAYARSSEVLAAEPMRPLADYLGRVTGGSRPQAARARVEFHYESGRGPNGTDAFVLLVPCVAESDWILDGSTLRLTIEPEADAAKREADSARQPRTDLETDYAECAECRAKPGCPRLCDACLHNRKMIGDLRLALADRAVSESLMGSPTLRGRIADLEAKLQESRAHHREASEDNHRLRALREEEAAERAAVIKAMGPYFVGEPLSLSVRGMQATCDALGIERDSLLDSQRLDRAEGARLAQQTADLARDLSETRAGQARNVHDTYVATCEILKRSEGETMPAAARRVVAERDEARAALSASQDAAALAAKELLATTEALSDSLTERDKAEETLAATRAENARLGADVERLRTREQTAFTDATVARLNAEAGRVLWKRTGTHEITAIPAVRGAGP